MTAIAVLLARVPDPHLFKHADNASLPMFTAATAITGGAPLESSPPRCRSCAHAVGRSALGDWKYTHRDNTHTDTYVQVSILSVIFRTIHPVFHSFTTVNWKYMHFTCKHTIHTDRQTSPVVSLCCVSLFLPLSYVEAAICKYADVVTVALHTHICTHHVQRAPWGKYVWSHHAWSSNHD